MAEKIATRAAYGKALAELSQKYDFVVMDADLSKSTMTATFKEVCPERFINTGIAEGNMMSTAAGIAAAGTTAFASTFAMFAAGRAFEQIRNSIGYPHLNVKIGATHAGITVGEDGASHQCNEDIGLMRTIPGMTIISPCDGVETKAAVEAAINHDGPVYLRLARMATPILNTKSDYKFEIGKGVQLSEGSDITIFATGIMVSVALEAKDLLAKENINARVINIHTIKPLDEEIVIKAAKETGALVTAEEHNMYGGLGSAVSEVLVKNCPAPLKMVAVEDKFGKSGKPNELLEKYGLTAQNIAAKAKEAIAMK